MESKEKMRNSFKHRSRGRRIKFILGDGRTERNNQKLKRPAQRIVKDTDKQIHK